MSNNKSTLVVVATMVCLAIAATPANARDIEIDGYGKETCDDLIELYQKKPGGQDAVPLGLWAMGYLLGSARHSNIAAPINDFDAKSVGRWLGEYCALHLDAKLVDALDYYIKEHPYY